MDKKIIIFDDTEIEEYEFHQYKNPISIKDLDINKIVVSIVFPSGKEDFKYFIGYKDSEKILPLCIFHPQMTIYKRSFDENRRIYLLTKEEKVFFFEYIEILEKVSIIIKNKFNSGLIYSKKYLKAERKR